MLNGLNFAQTWRFDVLGKPVPWSAPLIGRRGGQRKDPRLIEWQETVKKAAKEAYGPFEPRTGPICLAMQFLMEASDPALFGKLVIPRYEWLENQARYKKQGGLPDQSNLVKGTEDALNGIFYLDDIQVRIRADISLWATAYGCRIMVGLLDTDDPVIESVF